MNTRKVKQYARSVIDQKLIPPPDRQIGGLDWLFGWIEAERKFVLVEKGKPVSHIIPSEISFIEVLENDGNKLSPLRKVGSNFYHLHEDVLAMDEGDIDWQNGVIRLINCAEVEIALIYFEHQTKLLEWLEFIQHTAPEATLR